MALRRSRLKRGKGFDRTQSKPLDRRSELTPDPDKVREFLKRGRQQLSPVAKQGARAGTKATERLDARQEAAREAYGANPQPCANCGYGSKPGDRLSWVEAHHALSQQTVRRICRTARVNPHDWLWRPENRVWLCDEPAPNRCHTRHENHDTRLPHTIIPNLSELYEYCEELDDMLEAAGHHREAMATLPLEWR